MTQLSEMSEQLVLAMRLAKLEAKATGTPWTGTEHIFLGLLLEGEGVAAKAISEQTDASEIRQAIRESHERRFDTVLPDGIDYPTPQNLEELNDPEFKAPPLTARARATVDHSYERAQDRLTSDPFVVQTEDMLYGLFDVCDMEAKFAFGKGPDRPLFMDVVIALELDLLRMKDILNAAIRDADSRPTSDSYYGEENDANYGWRREQDGAAYDGDYDDLNEEEDEDLDEDDDTDYDGSDDDLGYDEYTIEAALPPGYGDDSDNLYADGSSYGGGLGGLDDPGNMGNTRSGPTNSSVPQFMNAYGINLTEKAELGTVDKVIGREEEIRRIVQILGRRSKNTPVLIGEPGVGKTAIAEGLAIHLLGQSGTENAILFSLNIGSLLSGTKYRGEFEGRLEQILRVTKENSNIILFIDEVHTLVGAGGGDGAMDASNIMKPAMARGELKCIGATTLDEYRKHIEKDPALSRRFQPIIVDEPSPEAAVEIIQGVRKVYESFHKLNILNEAVRAAVDLSNRYISDRYLPDKALDLIDEACSAVKETALEMLDPVPIVKVRTKLSRIWEAKDLAIRMQDFNKAASLREKELILQRKLIELRTSTTEATRVEYKKRGNDFIVTAEDIANIVAKTTGIPVTRLTEDESERLTNLEADLRAQVIGQGEAVKAVARAIRRARSGIRDPDRPIASLLFAGPTGVGKTELTKALARQFFGDEGAMIRLDMSEFMERHTVAKLIGAPPGYVGFDEGGQLTEAVRQQPYSLVLFDEVEKAHPEVFNIMLQIFDDGRLTDSHGKLINFKNTLLVMTSNLGSKVASESTPSLKSVDKAVGTSDSSLAIYDRLKLLVTAELKEFFRPEFLNRIDEIVIFRALLRGHVSEIANLMLFDLQERLIANKQILLTWADSLVEHLLDEGGFDPAYGARPLRRTLERILEDRITNDILHGHLKPKTKILVSFDKPKNRLFLHYDGTPDPVECVPDSYWDPDAINNPVVSDELDGDHDDIENPVVPDELDGDPGVIDATDDPLGSNEANGDPKKLE